jgi:hypothetical protein
MEPDVRRTAPGRLPERVYWFRRAVVLIALALVIALVMWLVSLAGGPRSGTPTTSNAAPPTTQTSSPPASLEATALPGPASSSASASASLEPSASAATTSAPPIGCDPAVLTLTLTGPGIVKAGTNAQFTVTVTNSGSDSCTFAFDSRFSFTIVSGTDEIWSTSDCAQWAPTGTHALAAGAAATWQTTWDRHRSQATCKVVPSTLGSGTYVANARYTGAATAQLIMLLTA